MRPTRISSLLLASAAFVLAACQRPSTSGASSDAPSPASGGGPTVGPATGSVLVVGGGAQGPEIFAKFIELAGGPDALIVEVPTAGGDSIDLRTVGRGLRAAGARNVVVVHTKDRRVADSDTFVAKMQGARGVWFGGGRHYRLVDSYAGTKSARAFEAVLARGGVVGGSSAGASILASYLVRGAPSNNNRIMNHPQYLTGFGYLRGVAVDQHVVARERLPDLHDSLIVRRADLLGLSEDEGTAWLVQGDTGTIIGRNKGFAYGGRVNDPGRPFLTLRPGDRYDLRARRVLSRAIDGSRLTQRFVDELLAGYRDPARGGATVLVAQDGRVLVNAAYGIPVQPRFTPETGAPLFPLGELIDVLLPPPTTAGGSTDTLTRRPGTRVTLGGAQRLQIDSATRVLRGNVDDLYRFELGRSGPRIDGRAAPPLAGFATDTFLGRTRMMASVAPEGRRGIYMRFPNERVVVLILTNDDAADTRTMAERIATVLMANTR